MYYANVQQQDRHLQLTCALVQRNVGHSIFLPPSRPPTHPPTHPPKMLLFLGVAQLSAPRMEREIGEKKDESSSSKKEEAFPSPLQQQLSILAKKTFLRVPKGIWGFHPPFRSVPLGRRSNDPCTKSLYSLLILSLSLFLGALYTQGCQVGLKQSFFTLSSTTSTYLSQ